jgi:DNA-binding PucR family transcriptional regulator
LFLDPLAVGHDGRSLVETLRAYLASGMNASAAAAALGISRRTVTSRLRASEKRLGRPIASSCAEIEVSLRLEELSNPTVRTGR